MAARRRARRRVHEFVHEEAVDWLRATFGPGYERTVRAVKEVDGRRVEAFGVVLDGQLVELGIVTWLRPFGCWNPVLARLGVTPPDGGSWETGTELVHALRRAADAGR